jgi:hypothetical protein
MKVVKLLAAALGSLVLACSASAAVVYENGALGGTFQSAQISPPQSLSDSFRLQNQTILGRATLGLWSPTATQPESLTWSIGASPFGSEFGTGAALLSNELVGNQLGFDIYLSTFDLNLTLVAGDYWLTLDNGASTGGALLGWDINFGPSLAFYRNNGDEGSADSEYFKLEGTEVTSGPGPSPVPEPASLALFAGGLICVAAARRRVTRTA